MANHKSALKRAGQNETRRIRNRAVRSRVRNMVKALRQAAAQNSVEQTATGFIAAQSTIDKAVKKGVLHKRTAARKISRLSKLAQKASV